MESTRTTDLSSRFAQPRLGQINYINSLPVTLPIQKNLVPINAQVQLANPSELNAAYAQNRLDLGAMSTYFFLKSTVMTLIPTLSIASDGAVGSVLFFAKERLGAVSSPKIAVPQASATSINLLKILLQEDHGSSPVLVSMTLPEIAGTAFDGALVIGDYALSVDAVWSKLYHRVDLGQWWKSKYGRPMVFGLWAARAEWADARPTEFKAISEALSQSLEIGLGSAFPQVLAEAHLRTGLACDRLEFYYRSQLSFAFDNRHLDGIEKYRSLCERYDLLPNTTPLQGAFQQISNCYT